MLRVKNERDLKLLQLTIEGNADDVTPKRRRDLEMQHQILLVAHCRLLRTKYPQLKWLHASLNGVWLPPSYRHRVKESGMEPGVLDLELQIRGVKGEAGLALDMKIPPNGATKEQRAWAAMLRENQWTAEFPTSALAAWRYIAAHLGIEDAEAEADLGRRQRLIG